MAYPAPTYQHHTVPIGGAPFIPPRLSAITTGPFATAGASQSSAGSSATSSPSSSPPSASASASASSWVQAESPPLTASDAAMSYSRSLHRHTSSMWEMERQNIEKSRLTEAASPTSPRSSATHWNRGQPQPLTRDHPPSVSSSRSSVALDFLLGRNKSRRSVGEASTGSQHSHRRNKSVV